MARKDDLSVFSAMLAKDTETGRLSVRHLQVLGFVVDVGIPITVGDLADRMGLGAPIISRTASTLAVDGYLKRTTSPSDRRIVLLEPTPAGRALIARVRANYAKATAVTAAA